MSQRPADQRADLVSQTEICRQLGISDQTWLRWRKARMTPEAIMLPSGRSKWRREDIDRLAGKFADEPTATRRRFQAVYAVKRSA